MIVSHTETAEVRSASAHRPGGITLTSLLRGQENSRDNFDLMIIDTKAEYHTPRHKHNFDQIRVMLSGSFEFENDSLQEEGTVGYFAEGTPYKQQGIGDSSTLLLQVAGASGDGYMSYAQLQAAIKELQKTGSFEDGLYVYENEDGKRRTMDGHQAAWEKTFGRKLEYPLPRVNAPIIMRPERYEWISDSDNPGVKSRMLGVFNERGLELRQLQLPADTRYLVDAASQPYLVYVMSGHGQADDAQWRAGSAIHVERGEQVSLAAEETSEVYLFGLPTFDERAS